MPQSEITGPVMATVLALVLLHAIGAGPPWWISAFVVAGGIVHIVVESAQ